MKKIYRFPLLLLLLLAVTASLLACGSGEDGSAEWAAKREAGEYSQNYVLTPGRKFCLLPSESGNAFQVYDSENGNCCGILDFSAHTDAGLHSSFDINLLSFNDHDGDGYSDFGIPMEDGSMVWYKYLWGSDPTKETDCFSFLELEIDAFDPTLEENDVDSAAVSDTSSDVVSDTAS